MKKETLQPPSLKALQSFLKYDEVNGGFVYTRKRRGSPVKPGDIAGVPQPNGMMTIMVESKRHYIHRLVWYWHHGSLPDYPYMVAHRDGDVYNNRIDNLEVVHFNDHRAKRMMLRDAEMKYQYSEYVS
jgi:hypothetical protein